MTTGSDTTTTAPAPTREDPMARAFTIGAFITAAVAFAFLERETFAGQCLVAAATLALPGGVLNRVPGGRVTALAVAIGAGLMFSGCAGVGAASVGMQVARVTCTVVQKAARACEALGLGDRPCPIDLEALAAELDATGGDAAELDADDSAPEPEPELAPQSFRLNLRNGSADPSRGSGGPSSASAWASTAMRTQSESVIRRPSLFTLASAAFWHRSASSGVRRADRWTVRPVGRRGMRGPSHGEGAAS